MNKEQLNLLNEWLDKNTNSEMRKETVEAYLGELKCEYFYHENSFIKQEYNETPVSEFPIDKNRHVMVYNSNSIFGEPIYREYLWQRRK